MKIYRAVFSYNNGDVNEWCEWFDLHSEWYASKELAEQHLPELRMLADAMRHSSRENDSFDCREPEIEEQTIQNEYTPIELREGFRHLLDKFSYIPYEGPHSISSTKLGVTNWPAPSWHIYITIGEEDFVIYFPDYDNGAGKYSIYPELGENSNFYRYSPEARKQLLAICDDFAKTIQPYAKEYNNRSGEWEEERMHENATILKLLQNTHLVLTDCSIEAIKYELENYRALECPTYKESLAKLLPFK